MRTHIPARIGREAAQQKQLYHKFAPFRRIGIRRFDLRLLQAAQNTSF